MMMMMMKGMVVLLLSVGLPFHVVVLGEQLPCPQSERSPPDCCPCNDALLCEGKCPDTHHATGENVSYCLTNITITTTAPITTTDLLFLSTTNNTLNSTQPPLFHCRKCHTTCVTCNGPRPQDCKTCADPNHELRAGSCLEKQDDDDSSGKNIGGIVGGVIGALAGVGVMVGIVVVVCLKRRKRRREEEEEGMGKRSISTLMGPTVGATSPGGDGDNVEADRDVERGGDREAGGKGSKGRSQKDPVYTNVDTLTPSTQDIQQGHEGLGRYSRDPTVKGQGPSSKTNKKPKDPKPAEAKELDDLPIAPVPPGQKTALLPPSDTYEIVETPSSSSTPPPTKPKPKPPQATPQGSYEPMELIPESGARTSRMTLPETGQKRRTTIEPHTSSSLPNPQSPISCPELVKFPMEKHQEKQKAKHQSQLRPNKPAPVPHGVKEKPDYINVGPEKGKVQDEDSDPGEDYENTGPMRKLDTDLHQGGKGSGEVPPGLQNIEEPQEVYGNQEMIDRQNPLGQNDTQVSSAQKSESESKPTSSKGVMEDSEDQPIYGNDEASDSDDPDYQNTPDYENTPRPRSQQP